MYVWHPVMPLTWVPIESPGQFPEVSDSRFTWPIALSDKQIIAYGIQTRSITLSIIEVKNRGHWHRRFLPETHFGR